MNESGNSHDRLEKAARQAAETARHGREDPEPSLGSRLGQIGLLGWMVVIPSLIALWSGRKLDNWLSTGILFTAAFLMLGTAFGFWLAWRWMHRQ